MSTEITRQSQNEVVSFNFFDAGQFETMQRICKMFASSELVPDMYKVTKDNPIEKAMSNCMIAIEIAQRIGASPLMVMQNMVPIYGKPSWSSKFLIATVNTCGRFNPLKFRFKNLGKVGKIEIVEYEWNAQERKKLPVKRVFDGSQIDNIECVAYTTAKGDPEPLESSEVSIKLAIEEGWYTKNGSKWKTMTKQMLMYRSASFWTSAYAPELSMGMKTEDEVLDIEDAVFEDVTDRRVKFEIRENANKSTMSFDDAKVAGQSDLGEQKGSALKPSEESDKQSELKQPAPDQPASNNPQLQF